jgi:hypothetical protein
MSHDPKSFGKWEWHEKPTKKTQTDFSSAEDALVSAIRYIKNQYNEK